MLRLGGVADGWHFYGLRFIPAVAGHQLCTAYFDNIGLGILVSGVVNYGDDGVEHVRVRAVHRHFYGALVFGSAGALHHGQVGVGERHYRGGVDASAHIQLAPGKRPGAAHGLGQVVENVAGRAAVKTPRATGGKQGPRRLRHAAYGVDGGGVAGVGSGDKALVFFGADGGRAQAGVLVDVAH